MIEAKEIIFQNKDWITFIFLSIFFTLTIVRVLFKDRLLYINTLFLSKKYLLLFNIERGKTPVAFQGLFFFVQLLVLSLLFYFASRHFQFYKNFLGIRAFFIILGNIGLYFCAKYFIEIFLAYLFNLKKEHAKIRFEKTSYLNNLTLWILPLLIFSAYTNRFNELFFEITLLLFVLLLILRYVLVLLNNKRFIFNNLFYFILYLCTLEIAPLIIVLKLTI